MTREGLDSDWFYWKKTRCREITANKRRKKGAENE